MESIRIARILPGSACDAHLGAFVVNFAAGQTPLGLSACGAPGCSFFPAIAPAPLLITGIAAAPLCRRARYFDKPYVRSFLLMYKQRMSFGESIATCLRKYATFSGRARRSEYWWWFLFNVLVGLAARVIDAASGTEPGEAGVVSAIVSLGLFLPSTAVLVRRLHDINRSGWWFGAPTIIFIVLMAGVAIIFAGAAAAANIDITNLSSPEDLSQGEAAQLAPYACSLMALGVLAFIWGVVLVVFMVLDGTVGPNTYGEDPKVRQQDGPPMSPPMPPPMPS